MMVSSYKIVTYFASFKANGVRGDDEEVRMK